MFMPRCPGNSIGFQIMRVCRRPDKIIYIYIFSSMSKNRHSRPVLDSFTGCSGPGNDRTTKIQRLKLRRANRWLLIIYCLVVEPYPSEKWWSSSVGMMTFNIWKNKKCSKAPTSLCTILRAHKNDRISVEPSILFVFFSWPRPNRERKLQLTPPGWTYQGRLWFLIYIPCSQNENISREIYMYTHFIYMYWMYWYCMDILFIYI